MLMTKFVIAKMPDPIQTGWFNITPEGSIMSMSGQDDCFSAFTMDLSVRDFHALISHDFLCNKSY